MEKDDWLAWAKRNENPELKFYRCKPEWTDILATELRQIGVSNIHRSNKLTISNGNCRIRFQLDEDFVTVCSGKLELKLMVQDLGHLRSIIATVYEKLDDYTIEEVFEWLKSLERPGLIPYQEYRRREFESFLKWLKTRHPSVVILEAGGDVEKALLIRSEEFEVLFLVFDRFIDYESNKVLGCVYCWDYEYCKTLKTLFTLLTSDISDFSKVLEYAEEHDRSAPA